MAEKTQVVTAEQRFFRDAHTARIIAGAGAIERATMTPDERALFEDGLYRMARLYAIASDMKALYDLMMDWHDEFLFACEVAKKRFDLAFGGCNPGGSQFGMSYIRPRVFGTANAVTYSTQFWWYTVALTTWVNLWGSSASMVTLPDTSGQRALIVFPMIMSGAASPKMHECWVHVEGTNYPIWVVKPWNRVGDIYAATLPGAILVGPGNSFHMRAHFDQVGNEEIFPFGIEYAIATYMRTE